MPGARHGIAQLIAGRVDSASHVAGVFGRLRPVSAEPFGRGTTLSGDNMQIARLILAVVLALGASASAASTGITIGGRTDQAYDASTGLLYLSTNGGKIQRYDPATNALLPAWSVGSNINAIDITPDHKYLMAVEVNLAGDQGTVYRVDLSNGNVSPFHYTAGEARGAFDIVTLNDGRAVFSADHQFSGASPPLRSIDYVTGVISPFTINGVAQAGERQSELWRNVTHSHFAMDGTNTSAGPFNVFSTVTEAYTVAVSTGTPLNGLRVAVSPNGAQAAIYGLNFGPTARSTTNFATLASLADGSGGFAFSPDGAILYTASFNAGSILKYRTSDFQQVGTIAVGAGVDLFPYSMANNAFTASEDGRYLFLYSANGLNVYAVPEPAGLSLVLLAGLPLLRKRRPAPPAK
jgi:DNA-binding beta-propeller fold protein YncE